MKKVYYLMMNTRVIDMLIIVSLGAITIGWFKGNYLIFIGDQYVPINVLSDLRNYFYSSWFHFNSIGISSPQSVAALPYIAYFAIMKIFGFSLVVSQKILYFFTFSLCGLSMYYLCNFIFKNNRRLICFCSSLFYMFNFFSLFSYWHTGIASVYLYCSLPLILGLYIKLLKTKKNKNIIMLVMVLSTVPLSAFSNPAMLMITLLLLLAYLLFYVIQEREIKSNVLEAFKNSLFLFLIWLFINLWWILPMIFSVKDGMASASAIGGLAGVFDLVSSQTSFLNLFRLFGYWPFNSINSAGDPFFPWSKIYVSTIFIFLGFFPSILLIVSMMKKRRKKKLLFFSILFIAGLFLMKGNHEPLGFINDWLFANIPFFGIFRNQYEKFGIIVTMCYSIFVGIGLASIYNFFKKYSFQIASVVLLMLSISMFGVYMWPFWTGDVIYSGGANTPSAHVKIPNYYYNLKFWSDNQKIDSKAISLPHQEGSAYDWGQGYCGSYDPTAEFFSKPIISETVNEGNSSTNLFLKYLLDSFLNKDNFSALNISSLANAKYIILHNDLNYDINTPTRSMNSQDILSNLYPFSDFYYPQNFDKINLFELKNDHFLPHLYTPDIVITSSRASDTLSDILSQPGFNIRSVIYFNNQDIVRDNLNINQSVDFGPGQTGQETVNGTPVIEFKKIDPTKYEVVVHHATENFPLVFSESFHSGWKAYLADGYKVNKVDSSKLSDYKILDGNADDQATADDVKGFIDQGYISTLGNLQEKNIAHDKWVNNRDVLDYNEKYKIDFISKDFQGTIQNDNLPNGNFWDTWFKKPLPEEDHIMVNGYANSWLIEPDQICAPNQPQTPVEGEGTNSSCVKNADGSYDFEMIIEFWPQRLFYIGLGISVTTLLGCVIYLFYFQHRRRKKSIHGETNKIDN